MDPFYEPKNVPGKGITTSLQGVDELWKLAQEGELGSYRFSFPINDFANSTALLVFRGNRIQLTVPIKSEVVTAFDSADFSSSEFTALVRTESGIECKFDEANHKLLLGEQSISGDEIPLEIAALPDPAANTPEFVYSSQGQAITNAAGFQKEIKKALGTFAAYLSYGYAKSKLGTPELELIIPSENKSIESPTIAEHFARDVPIRFEAPTASFDEIDVPPRVIAEARNFIQNEMSRRVIDWGIGKRNSLLLIRGPLGSGRDALAEAIARDLDTEIGEISLVGREILYPFAENNPFRRIAEAAVKRAQTLKSKKVVVKIGDSDQVTELLNEGQGTDFLIPKINQL
ncbi:MAG: hypothetical protein KDD53_03240, partial [Bdellovibrionales bacterium]|nr:hypothetical protein [Bdellovibrionales bacterium]